MIKSSSIIVICELNDARKVFTNEYHYYKDLKTILGNDFSLRYGHFTVIRRKMTTAKILINKFEDESNFKSLYVTILGEDNNASVRFGEWTEGIIQSKNKETGNSSRLDVKIVSGEEAKRIDLDYCAKVINNTDYSCRLISKSTDHTMHIDEASINVINPPPILANASLDATHLGNPPILNTQVMNYNSDLTNPLEQSLQKVKENNARIMENIHILNRTLNYTKKKEILDITCPKSLRTFPCNSCGKCFVYETGLRRHYTMRHAISEVQPRWQIVWTCIQCFQVWPRQDQALLHAAECCKALLDNQEFIREIKTSLLLQCEFCEKVFTSIPRLLRHSKIHTTDKNYECIPCAVAFMSYKTAEQHWPLCPWLKTFYCFSLPKMLLCNACDRKFRNYEQLYNHRYKMGHFMTKTHKIAGNVLGVLVYQCELCNHWYNSIPQMISHRSQHHPYDTGISSTDYTGNETVENYYSPMENEYYLNQQL